MLIYQNEEFQKLYDEVGFDAEWKERDFVSYAREYMNRASHKVLAIGGLRGTGKTIGLLQSVKGLDACYITAQKGDDVTGADYIEFLKHTDKKYIIIDEYSWIKDRKALDEYLYSAVQNGKRIAITGTESITLDFLNYGNLIHRVDMIHCTLFSYSEHCRLNNLSPCKQSCEDYLKNGGTFKAYAINNYYSMKDYIKTAIIDNLVAYTQMPIEKATAIVYSILYKAVCPSNLTTVPTLTENHLSVKNFLDEFGVNPDIEFTDGELDRVSDVLEQVGVIISVPNWERAEARSEYRTYIVNPSITYQLILAAYDIPEVNHYLLGEIYEASVMAHLYYHKLTDDNIYYLDRNTADGKNKELDIVVTQPSGKSVFLFECKLRQESKLAQNATILSDELEEYFPDGNIDGRYIVYTGKECIDTISGKTVVFTPLNSTVEHYYNIDSTISRLNQMQSKRKTDLDREE